MRTRFLIVLLLATSAIARRGTADEPAITQDELVRRTQELLDAVVPGNQEPFKKYFADDAMFFDEKGRDMDKAALVKDIQPMPKGYSGTIKLVRPKSHIEGDVAILSYDLDETETIFGQNMTARYHETDTWMRRGGKWQIVAGQVLRYYEDPAVGKADTSKFQALCRNVQAGAGTDDDDHTRRRPSLRDAQRTSTGRTDSGSQRHFLSQRRGRTDACLATAMTAR